MPHHATPATTSRAFTLIELLVVISIIALLIGILLPALSAARRAGQFAASASNQRQIGIGMAAYAYDQNGKVPHGPDVEQQLFVGFFLPPGGWGGRNWSQIASNQIHISSNWHPGGALHTAGVLLDGYLDEPKVMYSPGDDSLDPAEELEKFRNRDTDPTQDAYSSYFFRQLDQTSKDFLEDMGDNGAGVAATALCIDANNTDESNPQFYRTNFDARRVNILYNDGHVSGHPNEDQMFELTAADNAGFPVSNLEKLDWIFNRADYALIGNVEDTPTPVFD